MANMEPLLGEEILYLVQPIDATIGSDALIPGYPTESSFQRERETIESNTKLGILKANGRKNETFEITYNYDPEDPGHQGIEESYDEGKRIKVWRVIKRLNANDMHDAHFGFCTVANLESDEGDEFVENTAELPINISAKKGEIDPLPDSILNPGDYEFETPGETGAEDTSGV